MEPSNGVHVALVGLGFGAEFVPIYLDHPQVARLTIVDSDPAVRQVVGDRFELDAGQRLASLDQVLASDAIDAVHLVTPIPLHARQSIAVLNAGKHCACTVPMATSLDALQSIIDAQRSSGKVYMGVVVPGSAVLKAGGAHVP